MLQLLKKLDTVSNLEPLKIADLIDAICSRGKREDAEELLKSFDKIPWNRQGNVHFNTLYDFITEYIPPEQCTLEPYAGNWIAIMYQLFHKDKSVDEILQTGMGEKQDTNLGAVLLPLADAIIHNDETDIVDMCVIIKILETANRISSWQPDSDDPTDELWNPEDIGGAESLIDYIPALEQWLGNERTTALVKENIRDLQDDDFITAIDYTIGEGRPILEDLQFRYLDAEEPMDELVWFTRIVRLQTNRNEMLPDDMLNDRLADYADEFGKNISTHYEHQLYGRAIVTLLVWAFKLNDRRFETWWREALKNSYDAVQTTALGLGLNKYPNELPEDVRPIIIKFLKRLGPSEWQLPHLNALVNYKLDECHEHFKQSLISAPLELWYIEPMIETAAAIGEKDFIQVLRELRVKASHDKPLAELIDKAIGKLEAGTE